jgi:hypothetical protein
MIALFFNSIQQQVPDQLISRNHPETMAILAIALMGTLFIGLARISNMKSIETVSKLFLNGQSMEQVLKENLRLTSVSFILLIANFFVASGLVIWLLLSAVTTFDTFILFTMAIAVPAALVLFECIGIGIVGWITGESQKVNPIISSSLVGYAFFGLAFLGLVFIWVLNPAWTPFFSIVVFCLIGVQYLSRIFKSARIVLTNGVPWYYLILYFCTLEILPISFVYYYATLNFAK